MDLSAAILAGGHSSRMGRDKALLPVAGHPTLLQRQFAVLASLAPLEVLLSCRPDQPLPAPPGVRRIHDAGTEGPLAGLAALLEAMRGDMLLVLAVDLGRMSSGILARMLATLPPDGRTGLAPRSSRGVEPLAALYPRHLAADARRRLQAGHDRSLTGFVRAAVDASHLLWFDVPPEDEPHFSNWNSPADLR